MIVSQVLTSGNLDEMIAFYNDVFGEVEVVEAKDFRGNANNQYRHVKILGNDFFLMNGGEITDKVPALFYMVVFPENRRDELITLHEKLSDGARSLSDVKDMNFTEALYMFQDKFGLVWNFWSDAYCDAPVILPSMVMSDDLVGRIDEMKAFYEGVFDDVEFGEISFLDNGLIDHVSIRLLNHELQVAETSVKNLFSLDSISSLNLGCETQEEIDRYSKALGDHYYPGGWLKDKMGVMWCVDWPGMIDLLSVANEQQEQAIFGAIMKEDPICIEDVKAAFENNKE